MPSVYFPPVRLRTLAPVAAALLLAACGGGGGDAGSPPPTVTASSATSARYSETMRITLTGTNLDQALTLSSAGCTGFTRSTTAPYVSSATTAYYTCRVAGSTGAHAVNVTAAGASLANIAFTVPVPQVTMLVSNGAGGVAGEIVLTLDPNAAPITVLNFLDYVNASFYTNTAFHRHARNYNASTGVFSSWVLQGGGFEAPVTAAARFPDPKDTRPPITLEVNRGLSNLKYTLAMARTTVLNSATSQFFINTVDNTFLDTSGGGYAVFGAVTAGQSVVDAMVTATCTLSSTNFGVGSADCVPEPNLVVASATQTR